MQRVLLAQAISERRVRLTRHSIREATNDLLSRQDIFDSVLDGGEIIEEYPHAFPLPACLELGFTALGEPVHSV
ncbi:DUF4258 domain-containing protein [Gloeobacter morelensis]|uniref:DUF4258 domain-containing protein n=1 Tax=Gloeobacter morelensis TaxID=2907343 RepID=UPI003AB94230